MSKVSFILPIEGLQGTLSKSRNSFAIRYRNGKPYAYTYERHAPWSESQHAMRSMFGATTYFAYLILRIDGAAEVFENMRERDHYERLSAMVTSRLKSLLQRDESLREQTLQAYATYKALDPTATAAQKEAVKTSHLPFAKTLFLRLQAEL